MREFRPGLIREQAGVFLLARRGILAGMTAAGADA
jgi:hypothetical protein